MDTKKQLIDKLIAKTNADQIRWCCKYGRGYDSCYASLATSDDGIQHVDIAFIGAKNWFLMRRFAVYSIRVNGTVIGSIRGRDFLPLFQAIQECFRRSEQKKKDEQLNCLLDYLEKK